MTFCSFFVQKIKETLFNVCTFDSFTYRLPLQYSWSREGKNFPPGTRFMYDDRVMIIPNAQFADSGNYTCKVVKLSGNPNIVSKSVILDLEGKQMFTIYKSLKCLLNNFRMKISQPISLFFLHIRLTISVIFYGSDRNICLRGYPP
jgi:hypothetical protein